MLGSLNLIRLTRNGRLGQILSSSLSTAVKRRELRAPITLTENAANRIKEMLTSKEDVIGIRVSVKRRGCNGYSYIMNYANKDDALLNKDEKVESYGVKVFVDPKAVFYLVGTQMDWEETELASEFTFTNPNSKGTCGCGESFNV